MSAGEQRKHPRLSLQQTVVRNSLLAGRVLNLSLGGLAIETATAMRVGTTYELRVELHDHTVQIRAEVRWCRLTRTIGRGHGEVAAIFRAGLLIERPLTLFGDKGLQNSEKWFEPELEVPR